MALSKNDRNLLQKFVSSARKLLSIEYSRILEGLYGLHQSSGNVESIDSLTFNDDQEYETAKVLRGKIKVYSESTNAPLADVINRVNRELCFTTLNRFVAIKIFEKRGIVLESISKGYNSKGFQLYKRVCDTSLGETYLAFRSYLLSLFDEITDDLNSIFDRYNEFGSLFPREAILIELLNLINDDLLELIWNDDEALGWIYQYFNLDSERKTMRDQSKNPRDSRELAVRNQFFTPRYVVESLVDNTIGKYWVEANQGQSKLMSFCKYLLVDEKADFADKPKDPRDLKILDPACGSMHFGLYAFDVLEKIYEEAWNLEGTNGPEYLSRESSMEPLHQRFKNKDEFLKHIPKMIIENNIHGIDIDSRAAQIAQLAIWLRAQKSWNEQSVNYSDRPKISKSNIVTAEPIYITEELREYTKSLLGDNYVTFEQLEEELFLAPMLGSLVVFDKLNSIVAVEDKLFSISKKIQLADKPLNVSFLEFHNFKELFAKVLKFTIVLLKKYDAVLMNPPFGEAAKPTLNYLKAHYTEWNKNILCCFFEKGFSLLDSCGRVGAIFDRTAIVKSSYENFREKHLLGGDRIDLLIDLGWEVLDANVEVTSIVLTKSSKEGNFLDVRHCKDKEKAINEIVRDYVKEGRGVVLERSSNFLQLPNKVIGYDMPRFLRRAFREFDSLEKSGFIGYTGIQIKSDRHFRLMWECPNTKESTYICRNLYNGSGFSPYKTNMYMKIVSPEPLLSMKCDPSARVQNYQHYGKSGVCFGKRGEYLAAQVVGEGSVFTVEGQLIPIENMNDAILICSFLNSTIARFSLNKYCGQHKYSGYVNLLPYPGFEAPDEVINQFKNVEHAFQKTQFFDELSESFNFSESSFESLSSLVDHVKSLVEDFFKESLLLLDIVDRQLSSKFQLETTEVTELIAYREKMPSIELPLVGLSSTEELNKYMAHQFISAFVGFLFDRNENNKYFSGFKQNKKSYYDTNEIVELLRTFLSHKYGESVGEAFEQDLVYCLNVEGISDYLSSSNGFFSDHMKKFSQSRRVAPVYWPFSIDGEFNELWVCYDSLSQDVLREIANEYVSPKLRAITDAISKKDKPDEKVLEVKHLFEEFKNDLISITKKWKMSSHDGVLLNSIPFRKFFNNREWQKKINEIDESISEGNYEWSFARFVLPSSSTKGNHSGDEVSQIYVNFNKKVFDGDN